MLILPAILTLLVPLYEAAECCCGNSPPQYLFLHNAPRDAQLAFRRLFVNSYTTPRSQISARMEDWAREYNMTDQFSDYQRRTQQIRSETEQNVNTIMNQLPAFIADILGIKYDESLSEEEAERKTRALYDSVSRSLAGSACCILSEVSPKNPTSFSFSYAFGPMDDFMSFFSGGWNGGEFYRGKRAADPKGKKTLPPRHRSKPQRRGRIN
ncbi:hypothetical protein Aduo_011031 [Ancylostoma duodenale]